MKIVAWYYYLKWYAVRACVVGMSFLVVVLGPWSTVSFCLVLATLIRMLRCSAISMIVPICELLLWYLLQLNAVSIPDASCRVAFFVHIAQ